MSKKTVMIDMDEVIVNGRFREFLQEFLGEKIDFEKLDLKYNQELIIGREEEFRSIYQYKNLYKYDNEEFVKPIHDCVQVIEELNQKYDVYFVTTYVWQKDVIDAASNLKNKFEYLHYWFPFINTNNFIFITDKTKMNFDIGIDDRLANLKTCDKKLLFTETKNRKITNQELQEKGAIRVDTWMDVKKELL